MSQKFHNGGRTYRTGKGETDAELSARLAAARARDAADPLTRCDDCGKIAPESQLTEPRHLWERMDPGGVEPAGECECGALAYFLGPVR